MKLVIEMNSDKNIWTVEPIGDIDIHNSERFKEKVMEIFNEDKKDILIDGSRLNYIDSTGLGAFIYLYKSIKDEDHNIYLDNIKPNILKLLKITELDKILMLKDEDKQ